MKADLRDMEGGAIAQVAHHSKIPLYMFKAVSDIAGSGSTTEQYCNNAAKAMEELNNSFEKIFAQL
jgi:nucleoside phosphorylase